MMNIDAATGLTILGILVSIVLFLAGYRNTIGARRERIKTANQEIVDSLLKRLVHDELTLGFEEVSLFSAGTAREKGLKTGDVLGAQGVRERLYSRVISNDFIAADQRTAILIKLEAMAPAREGGEADREPFPGQARSRPGSDSRRSIILLATGSGVLALAITLAATGFVLEPQTSPDFSRLASMAITVLGAATAMAALALAKRDFEVSESTDQDEEYEDVPQPEYLRNFARMIKKYGVSFESAENQAHQFELTDKAGRVVLLALRPSLKKWSTSGRAKKLMNELKQALAARGAESAIIVTQSTQPKAVTQTQTEKVKVETVAEFRRTLMRIAGQQELFDLASNDS